MIEKGFTIELPPHGYVRYRTHLGRDEDVAEMLTLEAARISYKSPSKGEEKDKKLLEYLYKNRHTSPLEQVNITFNIKFPIFIMRQFVRHRTFRLNEWSGRYSEMADEFFAPLTWRVQDVSNKQSSVEYKPKDECHYNWHNLNTNLAKNCFQNCYETYKFLLDRGVAKEQARIVLPLSLYTEIYVNCDLHNLLHFFNLRTDPHSQKEMQDVAWAMLDITQKCFPWTIALWDKYKPQMVQVDGLRVK